MNGSLREDHWHVKLSHCSYRRILYNRLLVSTNLSHVRLGTSSWDYKGWEGLAYQRTYQKGRFRQDTLAENAGYRINGIALFRTVGIDRSFYRPAIAALLAHYAGQVPEYFRFCSKGWEEITIPADANLPRYGAKAGKPNTRFLDTGSGLGLGAGTRVGIELGPFIFEFQRWSMEPVAFLEALA